MTEMTRRQFVGGVGGALAAAPLGAGAQTVGSRPNILFICSDQHHPDALGYQRHPLVQTPNLDRLAREGTVFSNCYCGSPVCVPARASLLSGMFPSDVNSWCNSTPFKGQVPTWGNRLQDAGYYCRATGKMDLTKKADLGFDEIDTSHGHETSPDITSLFRRPLCYRMHERPGVDGEARERRHRDADVTDRTLEFLRDDARRVGKPWMMYVGYVAPHPSFVAPPRFYNMYPSYRVQMPNIPPGYLESMPLPWQATRAFKRLATPIAEDRIRRARAAYYGMVTELDERIGVLLQTLDETGQRDNTIVIYTSDHGESLGEHGLWYKNNPTDHASRVPLLFHGPGIPAGRRIDTPVMHVDLYPTFMETAGAAIPSGLRGHSLLPLCQGRPGTHPEFAYSECHAEGTCSGSFIIREGAWKYIHYSYYDSLLFNMEEDPGEFNNLIDTDAGRRVARTMHDRLRSLVDPEPVTDRGFAVQEAFLQDLCARMSLEELLAFGFERRLGKGQATILLKKAKGI